MKAIACCATMLIGSNLKPLRIMSSGPLLASDLSVPKNFPIVGRGSTQVYLRHGRHGFCCLHLRLSGKWWLISWMICLLTYTWVECRARYFRLLIVEVHMRYTVYILRPTTDSYHCCVSMKPTYICTPRTWGCKVMIASIPACRVWILLKTLWPQLLLHYSYPVCICYQYRKGQYLHR